MGAKKVTSQHQKNLYAAYKATNRYAVNRMRKLKRALKKNPGNAAQIEAAMKNIKYRRREATKPNDTTPKFKPSTLTSKGIPEKLMFRLKYRAHTNTGELIWTS